MNRLIRRTVLWVFRLHQFRIALGGCAFYEPRAADLGRWPVFLRSH